MPPSPATQVPIAHRLRAAALVAGIWVVLGVFLGTQAHVNTTRAGHPVPLAASVGMAVQRYLLYAALTFPVLWLCRRVPFTARRRGRWLMVQVFGFVGFAAAYTALRTLTGAVRDAETLRSLPPSLQTAIDLLRTSLFEQFWMYASIVGVILAIEHRREVRERERREADLRRRVAEYRLQVLRLQLQPHFLFNAMNGIATLMQRDVPTAREMLLRLSDLLRLALQGSEENETALREEIEFVRAYLDLEQMRFGERLSVHLAIDPASLDARVPRMILQPLVENAIRHGIGAVRAGGAVALATGCGGGRLMIRIDNDGPPLPATAGQRDGGVGLGNARARLRQIYGDGWHLGLLPRPGGGATLIMDLPFRGAPGLAEGGA